MGLFLRTLKAVVIGLIVLAALVFLPAGTLAYWQGWAFIAVFSLSTNAIGVYFALTDPALLERRMKAGPAAETRPAQKIIISLAFIVLVLMPVVSAFDRRFGWSQVPAWLSVLGNALVALGLMIDLRVFRENSYGASTIEMMEGQTVISTGPYALVRHPMYLGVLVMVLGTPLALGSWWGLLPAACTLPILMLRIRDEETMLCGELKGYDAYAREVRYRLVRAYGEDRASKAANIRSEWSSIRMSMLMRAANRQNRSLIADRGGHSTEATIEPLGNIQLTETEERYYAVLSAPAMAA